MPPPPDQRRSNLKALLRNTSLAVAALVLLATPDLAAAQDPALPLPEDGTTIQAEGDAQTKVQNDLLTIDLAFEKESPLLPELHAAMQQQAAAALDKAKATPEVRIRTSGYGIYPVYDKERIVRQHATYRLALETKNFDAGLALAANLQPFRISSLVFSVSPERRKATEKTLLEEAIADLRGNVVIAANALGAKTVTITTLTIGARQYHPVQPRMMQGAMAMAEAAPATPVAAEAGESQVSVTVSGSAQVK